MNKSIILLTGLSGAGKTTISKVLQKELLNKNIQSVILDGDKIRATISKDLGFSKQDRTKNILRIKDVAKRINLLDIVVIVACIAPYEKDRKRFRDTFKDKYLEIYVKCSLEELKRRDPYGLYKKAMKGKIKNFTGISSEYEEPVTPDLIINTNDKKFFTGNNIKKSVIKIMGFFKIRNKNE